MEYKQGGNWVDIWIKTRVINITRFWCAATVLVKVDNLFKEYLLPFTNMNRNNYKRKIIGNCQVLSVYAVKRNGFSIYKQICSQKKSFAKCGTRDELINYKINGCIFVWIDGKRGFYKSSSSSGSAVSWAAMYSSSCFFCHWGSIWTSGGSKAGMATNSRLGSPISLRANQRKGFSKL